ncbi:MAG TPA: hypothetical protein VGM88_03835 [Kofleriaceae bacterium]|jgi:hypothetical protein
MAHTLRFVTAALSMALVASPASISAWAAGGKKTPAKAAPAKAPVKKPPPPVSAEHKKALGELLGGFKFGMTKDEVIAVYSKKLEESYADKRKQTTDVAEQDRLSKDKRAELAQLQASYVEFGPKPSPWDVSIIEDEAAHNTEESMLERWENQGGKNQRRFFFFYQGKLWKMIVSLDVSILPEDKKTFATFAAVMNSQYGEGDLDFDAGRITWRTDDFEVRAMDKLKTYDALAIAIEDPKVRKDVLAEREVKAPPKHETNAVIKAVIDPDQKDHPDVKENSNAVDAVIKAQGGGGKKP